MGLADRVDWIAKLQIIERERERSGVELSDPKIALIDLLYHDTSFERGLYYRRQARGHLRRMVSDEESPRPRTRHPDDTRAHAWHLHQGRQRVASRLHRRLGPLEVER